MYRESQNSLLPYEDHGLTSQESRERGNASQKGDVQGVRITGNVRDGQIRNLRRLDLIGTTVGMCPLLSGCLVLSR